MPDAHRARLYGELSRESRRYLAAYVMFNRAIADHLGLHPTDVQCLGLLTAEPGPLTVKQIADMTGLTREGDDLHGGVGGVAVAPGVLVQDVADGSHDGRASPQGDEADHLVGGEDGPSSTAPSASRPPCKGAADLLLGLVEG